MQLRGEEKPTRKIFFERNMNLKIIVERNGRKWNYEGKKKTNRDNYF
jgi:hypothetical protein